MSLPKVFPDGPGHVLDRVAAALDSYLGVTCDLIHLAIFVSLASGCMAAPIPLDIASNSLTADLMITNRILDLRRARVRRIDTREQLRELERKGFSGHVALLIGCAHPALFREATELVTRMNREDFRPPSLIRITDYPPRRPAIPAALRLTTALAARDLDDFGHAYATARGGNPAGPLSNLVQTLPVGPPYPSPFQGRYRGRLRSDDMLLFERLLLVLAALRVHDTGSADVREEILPEDYRRARALLMQLPVCPVGTALSPRALEVAEVIYEALRDNNYQRSVPDHSTEGHKWFRRAEAVNWTGLSYSAVKEYLTELEKEGLLRSTVAETDRMQGREIHYRFNDFSPPFAWRNPFAGLPELDELAGT
jgi:hypothetical protein